MTTDLAGNARFVGTVDLGPYEYQGVGPETPSLVVTTNVDVVDAYDGVISLREAIQYAEADATLGDVITFAASLKGATITLSGTELKIAKRITIDASALYDASTNIPGITVDADEKSRVFYVSGVSKTTPIALIGLTISGGKTNGYGGGVYAYQSATTLTNCVVSGNAAERGGGVYAYDGNTTLANCVVRGNTASSGAGVFVALGNARLTNCAVSANTARNYGGGVYLNGSTSTLRNSIVVQNDAKSGADVYDNAWIGAHNTLSSYAAWDNASAVGVVNYVYDASTPLFTDAANGDYTLAANSQAIDKGNNSYISGYSTDLAGNARVVDGTVDLGPYEYQQATALTSVALKGTAQVGETLTATVSPSGATATYQWRRVDANNVATAISGATESTYDLTSADLGYFVQVIATGSGNYVGSVSTTIGPIEAVGSAPAAPTNVTFAQNKISTAGGTCVNVKWTDVATDETGYRVEVREVGATAWTLGGTTKADKQAFTYQDFTPGVAYEWRVRAENAFGASSWATGAFTALTAPEATVASYDASAKTATLTLAAPTLAAQMRVEVSTAPFATEATISSSKLFYCVTLKSSTATPTIKNLEAGTTYYVRVRAINDAGVSDWCDTLTLQLPVSNAQADAVSEAFADFFAEDGGEDDFWFEFEKAAGKRR